MIGKCYQSSNIADALVYGRNPLKGGEVLLANLTEIDASPEEQARQWEAMSNDYSVNCYCLVLSFSRDETKELRSLPGYGGDFVRTLMREFIDALADKGNDISDCPYIATRHGNTDYEHYHLYVLTTTSKGRKMNDSYIRKNTARAAAKVALAHGLDGAQKSMEREKAHQEAVGQRQKQKRQRNHNPSATQEEIIAKLRRKRAVEEANKRKKMLKFVIENVAKGAKAGDFMKALEVEGLTLFMDDKKGLSVLMQDGDKTRKYSLAKDLGVNMTLLPELDLPGSAPSPRISGGYRPQIAEGSVNHNSAMSKVVPKMSRLNASGGRSAGVNRENEVNSGKSSDDLDEEWKRKNGYHL